MELGGRLMVKYYAFESRSGVPGNADRETGRAAEARSLRARAAGDRSLTKCRHAGRVMVRPAAGRSKELCVSVILPHNRCCVLASSPVPSTAYPGLLSTNTP